MRKEIIDVIDKVCKNAHLRNHKVFRNNIDLLKQRRVQG